MQFISAPESIAVLIGIFFFNCAIYNDHFVMAYIILKYKNKPLFNALNYAVRYHAKRLIHLFKLPPLNLSWSRLPSLLIRDSFFFSYLNNLNQIRFFGRVGRIGRTLTIFFY